MATQSLIYLRLSYPAHYELNALSRSLKDKWPNL